MILKSVAKQRAKGKDEKYALLFHERNANGSSPLKSSGEKRNARERETHMKGEFDACLVIQVAGNDFTSSNLLVYAFILCGDFIAHIANGMSGYIKPSL